MCWCPGALAGPAPGYQAPPQLLQLQMLSSPNLSLGVNAKTHTYKDRQTQRHNHTQKYTQLASTTTVVAAAPPPDFPHPTSPPSRLLSRRLLQPPACRQQLQPACRQQDNKAQSTACRGQPAMTSQALLCFLAVQNSSRGDLVTDSLTHSLTE